MFTTSFQVNLSLYFRRNSFTLASSKTSPLAQLLYASKARTALALSLKSYSLSSSLQLGFSSALAIFSFCDIVMFAAFVLSDILSLVALVSLVASKLLSEVYLLVALLSEFILSSVARVLSEIALDVSISLSNRLPDSVCCLLGRA